MIRERRRQKQRQQELRRVQLGDDYNTNPDKRRALAPIPAKARR